MKTRDVRMLIERDIKWKQVCVAIAVLVLIGCGRQQPVSVVQLTPDTVVTPAPIASAAPGPTSTATSKVSVTVYSLTKKLASGVSVTGYCVLYQGDTYCWDDGYHFVPYADSVSYWMGFNDVGYDIMSVPTLITTEVYRRIEGNTSRRPEEVFANGTASTQQVQL